MAGIESIEKLRKFAENAVYKDNYIVGSTFDLNRIADEIEAEIAERYMELPVDVDGVPLRYEDEVVSTEDILRIHMNVVGYSLDGVECMTKATKRIEAIRASLLRHVKSRTIEDVLVEFLQGAVEPVSKDRNIDLSQIHFGVNADKLTEYANEIRGLL